MLEQEDGNTAEARRLFALGAEVDPSHTYIWQVRHCTPLPHEMPHTRFSAPLHASQAGKLPRKEAVILGRNT